MSAADIQRLFDSCDRSTAVGLRDFAVMTLVAPSNCLFESVDCREFVWMIVPLVRLTATPSSREAVDAAYTDAMWPGSRLTGRVLLTDG